MTLHIRTATDVGSDELYTIIVDSLEVLLGEGAVLWETVPRIGDDCLIAVDAAGALIPIGFHPREPWRALMAGLSAMDQLNNALAALPVKDYRRPERLIVLASDRLPGADTLARCGPLTLLNFKLVEVNGERGLFLETPKEPPGRPDVSAIPVRAANADEPGLTREEEDFFASV